MKWKGEGGGVDLRSTIVCADATSETTPGPTSFAPRTVTSYTVPLSRPLKVTMVVCASGVMVLSTDTPARKSSTNQISEESVPASIGGGCRGIVRASNLTASSLIGNVSYTLQSSATLN